MLFNAHLLKINQTVEQYKTWIANKFPLQDSAFLNQLPAYTFARCPFCSVENVERLNTYSAYGWSVSYGRAVFNSRLVVHHCNHFTLVQSFFHFHGIWPAEAKGLFGPEVPHVIGHLLESDRCLAVIHALPICRIEDQAFVPRYTLFMVSYFSERPEEAYDAVIKFSVDYVEPGVAWVFIPPPNSCEHWWHLGQWVSTGQLFWVDGNDPALGIRTHDISAFPYIDITGRTRPYFHRFPYPLPKPRQAKSKRKPKAT
jgi:hypothetical protein